MSRYMCTEMHHCRPILSGLYIVRLLVIQTSMSSSIQSVFKAHNKQCMSYTLYAHTKNSMSVHWCSKCMSNGTSLFAIQQVSRSEGESGAVEQSHHHVLTLTHLIPWHFATILLSGTVTLCTQALCYHAAIEYIIHAAAHNRFTIDK